MSQRINPYKRFEGAWIPQWLMCRKEISQGAKLAYSRLAKYAGKDGKCFPKQKTLSKEIGVSPKTVRKYLKELVDHELLEKVRVGLGKPNRYYFLKHQWMGDEASEPERNRGSVQEKNKGSEQEESMGSEQDSNRGSDQEKKQGSAPNTKVNDTKVNHNKVNHTNDYKRADVEKIFNAYPIHSKPSSAKKEIKKALKFLDGYEHNDEIISEPVSWLLEKVKIYASSPKGKSDYAVHSHNWFAEKCYLLDPKQWQENSNSPKTNNGSPNFEQISNDVDEIMAGRREAEKTTRKAQRHIEQTKRIFNSKE